MKVTNPIHRCNIESRMQILIKRKPKINEDKKFAPQIYFQEYNDKRK